MSAVQELDRIADELNMTDEQQRAFIMKATMKEFDKAMALPRRTRPSPVEDAMTERIFATEKGFLKNSDVSFYHTSPSP